MNPVQTIARRRLLAGLVGLPAALVAIPGHALALVSPKRAAWSRADAAFLAAEDHAWAAQQAYEAARKASHVNSAKLDRECPPFPTEAMTVRDPERVAAFNARCAARNDEDGLGYGGRWAQFVLSGEPNINSVFADAPAERDHYLAIYREWMRPRLPYLQRRDALYAAEAAAREAHALAEAQEITAARAMILTPSPSPKATAYKMELAANWRFRGIAWATTAHLAERTTRAEVAALADRAA
jgi:hypothetical protein